MIQNPCFIRSPTFFPPLAISNCVISRCLPCLMSMQRKTLTFRLRYPRKHTHFYSHFVGDDLCYTHDGTVSLVSFLLPLLPQHNPTPSLTTKSASTITKRKVCNKEDYVLPTTPTDTPLHTLPTPRCIVFISFNVPWVSRQLRFPSQARGSRTRRSLRTLRQSVQWWR